jgi:molybdopterin synthase catalytic subunit
MVAVASSHREEGFAACQYAVDRFKQELPTRKTETYLDGSIHREGA